MWLVLGGLVVLMLPLGRVVPPLYQFRVRSRVFRWYAQLRDIEQRADNRAEAPDVLLSELETLETNANKMLITAPMDGLVVLRSIWKGGQMGEAQEGEEMWSGTAFLDLVGPSAMRVRVKVNQADVGALRVGLPARVTLDAYPGKTYAARLQQVAPVGLSSQFSPKVRSFIALFEVQGVDPQLTPDLSAAVDVELERVERALIAPREAIEFKDGRSYLRVKNGSATSLREVTLGPMNDRQVVITSGA